MKTKESYSAAARQRAEQMFSKGKNIRMYLDIYETLLKNERSEGKCKF